MSIAAMKRKTLNGNPRLGPVSGSNNGRFGFSLNGTRRNVGRVGVTNLAPGAMAGPTQMIGSTVARPTGPGIHGHPSSVCTNDPLVVKTTVINTRGMLSRRAHGFSRAVPMAPYRDGRTAECGLGPYIAPPEEYDICGKDNNKTCPPIWVKNNIVPNGNQGEYISRFVRVRGNTHGQACDSNKSYNGIIGYVNGLPIPDPSCNSSWGLSNGQGTGSKPLEGLLFEQRGNFIGTRRKTSSCPVTKPGLITINYTDYNSRRVLIKNCLPATGINAPIPNSTFNADALCRKPNVFNVNIPPGLQGDNVYNYLVENGEIVNITKQLKAWWCAPPQAQVPLGVSWGTFVEIQVTKMAIDSTGAVVTKIIEISGILSITIWSAATVACP